MALPGVTLFPNALLPLYIFETRYREMLASVLAGDRIFAVGMVRPDGGADVIFPVAGAGLIRACVGQPDGTSQLILQGLGRVRFTSFTQTEPFLAGPAEAVATVGADAPACAGQARELQEICRGLVSRGVELPEDFIATIGRLTDPETLGDLLGQHMVRDPIEAQAALSEPNLELRLRRLIATLRREWQQFAG